MPEKNCGIYWLDSYNLLTGKNSLKSSKQLKVIFIYVSVLNKFQNKQFLCILALAKKLDNAKTRLKQFSDQKNSEKVQTVLR